MKETTTGTATAAPDARRLLTERAWRCPFCQLKFYRQESRDHHVDTVNHTGPKP